MLDVIQGEAALLDGGAATLTGHDARLSHIALIGNYPPRQCGIATFTADLHAAMAAADRRLKIDVVAMSDGACELSGAVDLVIEQDNISDYLNAARQLNERGVEMVCVQHEFGIFGGPAGENLIVLLENLCCPVVTELHTVLDTPNEDQSRVMAAILRRSARVVVMAEHGKQLLIERYHAPAEKIVVIPHGAPDFPFVRPEAFKLALGLEGREVLLTFGLLSPNKGMESVIRAMPEIVSARPNALYVILGATHPKLLQREGEAYRESLVRLAEERGVSEHVRFVNAYVTTPDLLRYLAATDIYVTPYLNARQITSGTLSYAVALGKPVVSTPYWHAKELLADGVGKIVGFNDSDGFALALIDLLSDARTREAMSARAYARGRETIWARAGERHLALMTAIARKPRPSASRRRVRPHDPDLRAVLRMTDACGMLQHAIYSLPDRTHGYCLDDNARALILTHRARAAGFRGAEIDRLIPIYAAFVIHAWNESVGRFRNFMSYERRWLEDVGSEDSFGRALWALGETAHLTEDSELRRCLLQLADRVIAQTPSLTSLHASAFAAIGLAALTRFRRESPMWRTAITACLGRLQRALAAVRRPGWVWFKQTLAYDNARLPQAMIAAGSVLGEQESVDAGLEALAWLAEIQIGPGGCYSPVGNESFGAMFAAPAVFDQQPLEAAAMIDACWLAQDISGDARWSEEAERAYAWFFGGNVLGARMAAPDGAGCFDGLGPNGSNRNQGAESILALQLSNCTMKTRLSERERRSPAR